MDRWRLNTDKKAMAYMGCIANDVHFLLHTLLGSVNPNPSALLAVLVSCTERTHNSEVSEIASLSVANCKLEQGNKNNITDCQRQYSNTAVPINNPCF